MAVAKVLARDCTITCGGTEVKGLSTIGLSNSSSSAETTDFDSAGWAESFVAERSMSMTLEGMFLEDVSDKSRDPGQAAVEVLGKAVGSASVGAFVYTTPGGTTCTFSATVELGDVGGGNNDPMSWSATLTVTGAPVWA